MFRGTAILYLLAVVASASSALAQSAPSTPSSSSTMSAQTKPAEGTQKTVPTIKTNAQLVIVDVVVTDRSHKAVHGLKATDFTLTENNVAQAITHFEEHTALTSADATKFDAMPKLPPGIFTNYTPAPASGAVNILLLDWLNTPLGDQSYARQQFVDYLKSVPPGTRMAVFGLSTHLYMLQGFTSDTSLLKAALDREHERGAPMLNDQIGGGGTQNNLTDDLEDAGTLPDFVLANLRQFDAMGQTFETINRTKYTLDAMNQIARYLSGIPGRKNLIWFSGSFSLDILPDESQTQANPFAAMGSSEDEFFDTVTRLAHAQVSMYPIDVRGIQVLPMSSAATTRNYSGAVGGRRLTADNSKFLRDQASEHATMEVLADKTGGRAFFNTNGLTQAVRSAVEEGSNFYTLTYTPLNAERDGKQRKIKISLSVPGAALSYRRGYYADAPNKGDKAVVTANATDVAPAAVGRQESLRLAMMRGAPTPSEILIKVAVERMTTGGKTEDQVAASNRPAPTAKGPFQRYAVNYAISPHDLTWVRGDDGKVHIDYDVLVYVYDANGELQNWVGGSHHVAGSVEQVQGTTTRGILLSEEISVPAKGQYFLRIGVRDQHRDHYGVVEVATSQVRDVALVSPAKGSAPAAK